MGDDADGGVVTAGSIPRQEDAERDQRRQGRHRCASAGKLAKERTDIGYAEENVEAVQARLTALDAEFHAETEKLATHVDPTAIELEELTLQPKKADITISQVALVWTPWSVAEGGTASLLA